MIAVAFRGKPVQVEFRPALRAHRGKLLLGGDRGAYVHAASFLRDRRIVLDRSLLRNPRELDRILAHEIFHFVWWKLGRAVRSSYSEVVSAELAARVPGEMGWSAEWRKDALRPSDSTDRTRAFREYLCESFCDSAAAHLLALVNHPEITLPAVPRRRRTAWMRNWMEATDVVQEGLKI